MSKFSIQKKEITVAGEALVVRAMSARERGPISVRCKTGEEMTAEAVLLCTTNPDGSPAFESLSEVLDAPFGIVSEIGAEILELSGVKMGDKAENPT